MQGKWLRESVVFRLSGLIALAVTMVLAFGPPAANAADEMAIHKSGNFEGRSDHITTGTVSLQKINEAWILVLEENFDFDGAPDPKLAFGDGDFVPSTVFTPLKANSGLQDYMLPDHIDPAGYTQVWLWCEQFNVPLGVAEIQ